MSRKNTILGLGALAAFGFASMAFAQCPSGPVPPWSSESALGGSLEIVENGYAGTSCRLDAAIVTTGPGSAFVRDNTPADEPRYRAQFIVNVDELAGLNSIQSVKLLGVWSENAHLSINELVRLTVNGNLAGTVKNLNIFTVNEGATGNIASAVTPLAAGENVVEIDWNQSTGSLDVWVNNGNEASPTLSLSVNNSSWGGVDYVTLGLANASPQYRASQINKKVGFDEFDSRRSTFIGL